MYINVKGSLINFDKVCFIKHRDDSVVIYFDYSECSQYTVKYNTVNEAEAAYKELEKLLTGKE